MRHNPAPMTSLEEPTQEGSLENADAPRSQAPAAVPGFRGGWSRPRMLGLLAIAALTLAVSSIEQGPGPSATSHFALIRALASGTAEIGPGNSIDTSYINGRYYANKAPGLAFVTLPPYLALRALGLQEPARRYESRLWQLTLFGAALPTLLLLLLIVVAVERVVPGYGPLTAVLLGAGTMLLPFSTLLFGHALSATLGFGAFVVLFLERLRGPSPLLAAVGGVLAGLAVTVEYPLGIVVVVLAAYVAGGGRIVARLGAYAAGCLAGAAPLLAYNTWAFGSPTTLSYSSVITGFPADGGPPPLGSGNSDAFYGVSLPDLRVAGSLLLSEKGLFLVAPICVAAVLGFSALWKIGRRAETLVCAAVPILFLAYNAGYYIPFGGQGPGPRFLVPALPFLALPLALALRRHLGPTLALALASVVVMAVATVTSPLTGDDHPIGDWFADLRAGRIASGVVDLGGADLVPFALLLLVAVVLAISSAPLERIPLRSAGLALVLVAAWLVIARAAPSLLPANADHGTALGAAAVTLLVVCVVVGLVLTQRRGLVLAAVLLPLALLVLPAVHTRQSLALVVTLGTLCLVVTAARTSRPRTTAGPGG